MRVGRPGRDPAKRVLPPKPTQAAIVMLAFVALLYVIELVNLTAFGGTLAQDGIESRSVPGLLGIIWAPLIHASWAHLFGNTVPFAVFGFLAMAAGMRPWIATTVLIWVISGIGVWLTGPSLGDTIGASGIAFGWLAFLLVRGLFNRSAGQVGVAVVLLFFWGGILFGLLPGSPHISWQAHLFGALGGILAAWLTAKANHRGDRPAAVKPGGTAGGVPFPPRSS